MGIATFPAASGGLASVVKSLQRGTAASAGNITISAVDTAKTICNSFSTGSAGSVAASGTINAASGTASAQTTSDARLGTLALYANFVAAGNALSTFFSFSNYTGRYSPRQPASNFNLNSSAAISGVNVNAQNVSLNATNLTGGSTSLTSAVYGIHLVNSTTITATGPCRYEVIEYF